MQPRLHHPAWRPRPPPPPSPRPHLPLRHPYARPSHRAHLLRLSRSNVRRRTLHCQRASLRTAHGRLGAAGEKGFERVHHAERADCGHGCVRISRLLFSAGREAGETRRRRVSRRCWTSPLTPPSSRSLGQALRRRHGSLHIFAEPRLLARSRDAVRPARPDVGISPGLPEEADWLELLADLAEVGWLTCSFCVQCGTEPVAFSAWSRSSSPNPSSPRLRSSRFSRARSWSPGVSASSLSAAFCIPANFC